MLTDYRPVDEGQTASTPGFWARNFADTGRLSARHARIYRSLPEFALISRYLPRGAKVLDAGSGEGAWVALLRQEGYDAAGLDYSDSLIARAKERYPDARWAVGDIRASGLPDDHFDGIISWGVIEHEEAGPGAALAEFRRILKPGGHAIVTVPGDHARQRQLVAAQSAQWEGGRLAFFQYCMTSAELAAAVAGAGFDVREQGPLCRPSAELVLPEFYARHGSNRFVVKALYYLSRLRPVTGENAMMVYCVGAKPE